MRMAMPRSSGQVARSGFTGGGLSVHREREHEHAARLPETGHGELARADEPPGRGQRLELLFGPAALHGEKAAVRGDQPPRLREQLRQRCERARAERADACEVVAAVPAGELLEEREQPTRVGTGQANTEAGRILDQVLGGTQLHGTQTRLLARSSARLIILRRCDCCWWKTTP